jgi:sugar lactone lactonase YvrE
LTAACGVDDKKDDPDQTAGAGGDSDAGGSGGKANGGTRAGTGGSKPVAGTSSEGGMGGDGADPMGGSGGVEEMGGGPAGGAGGEGGEPPNPIPPVDCSKLAMAPAAFEELEGFTSSEDFAFDALGNYVGVDGDNNLVRISKDGKKELWAPAIGSTAGMAILPDGSVIIADVGNGALKRVYPSSGSEPVIGGLLYPNGLDIGPDGFVYVCENFAGRVRRVNPDNGEFTIVAMGLHGCNGVAFSNDPHVLYIGSFEGSGVYKVQIPAPGELGEAHVFARPNGSTLEEPVLACPDQEIGKDCTTTTGSSPGKCKQLSNVVDCVPAGPCDDVAEGGDCQGGYGTCKDGQCIPKDCADPNDPSCCQGKECGPPNPCEGLNPGDECTDPFNGKGVCTSYGGDVLFCEPPNPCDGLNAGDKCESPQFGVGECVDYGDNYLYCEPPNPCKGKADYESCEFIEGGTGVCYFGYCNQVPCTDSEPGFACYTLDGNLGVCQGPSDGPLTCKTPCDGKQEGAECNGTDWSGTDYTGTCQAGSCLTLCTKENVGEACFGPSGSGECAEAGEGQYYCDTGGSGGPGGIDGLGVDACGYVYASEYVRGNVWRISPAGEIELLAHVPSGWIPNIKWGRDVGGFSKEVMYIADRDEGRLFGVSVGVPGVTEYYDLVSQ